MLRLRRNNIIIMEHETTSLRLGDYNTLTVTRLAQRDNPHSTGGKETFGIFLDGGREGDILMPKKYVPEGTKVMHLGEPVWCLPQLGTDEGSLLSLPGAEEKDGDR